ncbi:MAG TPA: Gmad2 immunoglobulin-like domain-containing protein [Gaiellaceae bacterium]|nr:Gmad2 immunoglobulin-like domain-containing protein [Gaiellaceae bacterium]
MRRLWLVGLVALVAAGCGSTRTVTVTTTVTRTITVPAAKKTVRVYFMRDGKVGPVARELETVDRASLLAAVAAGPTEEERAIGFTQGEATERTAEEVYTLSQFDPTKPVDAGGASHTRGDFEELTPAILVESPLPFASVSSPLRVWGTANTFEATFDYELVDASGKVLSKHFVTATSGTGTRGTYDFTVRFAGAGAAKLRVFELSAADGSRIHQVEIPLTIAR